MGPIIDKFVCRSVVSKSRRKFNGLILDDRTRQRIYWDPIIIDKIVLRFIFTVDEGHKPSLPIGYDLFPKGPINNNGRTCSGLILSLTFSTPKRGFICGCKLLRTSRAFIRTIGLNNHLKAPVQFPGSRY